MHTVPQTGADVIGGDGGERHRHNDNSKESLRVAAIRQSGPHFGQRRLVVP